MGSNQQATKPSIDDDIEALNQIANAPDAAPASSSSIQTPKRLPVDDDIDALHRIASAPDVAPASEQQAAAQGRHAWGDSIVAGLRDSGAATGVNQKILGALSWVAGEAHLPGVRKYLQGKLGELQRVQEDYAKNYAHDPLAHAAKGVGDIGQAFGTGEVGMPVIAGTVRGGAALAGLGENGLRAADAVGNLLTGPAQGMRGAGRLITQASSGAAQSALGGALLGDHSVGEDAALGAVGGVAIPRVLGLAHNALAGASGAGGSVYAKVLDTLAPREAGPAIHSSEGNAQAPPEASGASSAGAGGQPGANTGPVPPPSQAQDHQPPPEAIRLGIFDGPKDAQKVARQILDSYAKGGPTEVISSKIPGVHLTLAQATGNPNIARLENLRRTQNPNPFNALEQANTEARNAHAQRVIGTEDQLQAAEAARSAAEEANRAEAFGNQQPVDVTPVRQHLARLIDDNRGRDTVQKPLLGVLRQVNAAADENGMALPEHLWNVRKYLGDIVSPAARGTAKSGHAAAAQLLDLKPTITDAMEAGAPGFRKYAQAYEEMSRPIDSMRFLQSRNLTDAQGNVRLGQLDALLKSIKRERGRPGVREADSVADHQISALQDLRDDMRLAQRIDLGKARGSDTAQNLFNASRVANMLNGASPMVASRAAGALSGALLGGPVGAVIGDHIGQAAKNALQNRLAGTAAAVNEHLDNALLAPTRSAGR